MDDPLVSDRPDTTDTPFLVSPGRLQVEGGYEFAAKGDERAHDLGQLLLRTGLTEWLELRLSLDSFVWNATPRGTTAGVGAPSIGAKIKLAGSSGVGLAPAVALFTTLSFPAGEGAPGSEPAEPQTKLAAFWSLNSRWAVATNVGWAWRHDSGANERFNEFAASVSLSRAIGHRWTAFAEYYGDYPDGRERRASNFVDTGALVLLSPDLQLDGRIGRRLDSGSADWFLGFGATVRW